MRLDVLSNQRAGQIDPMTNSQPREPEPTAAVFSTALEFDFAPAPSEALVVDVAGFEGPLDLLLALARTQKVDLAQVSMLALAEQYLAFIEEAEKLRLELAGDYLVMAAWLAYLKSKLLLPREEQTPDGPTGEELAQILSHRLRRLEAMRQASARLMSRPRLGRDQFGRGMPEGVKIIRESTYTATVYDLLKAYCDQRRRAHPAKVTIAQRVVWSIKEARQRLERLIGVVRDWGTLDDLLMRYAVLPEQRRSVLASSFGAVLEMTREGQLEIRQSDAFGPLLVRRRGPLTSDGEAGRS
jgi:segregation and condensation protein A